MSKQDYSASKSLMAARIETRVIEKERIVRDHAGKTVAKNAGCGMPSGVGEWHSTAFH